MNKVSQNDNNISLGKTILFVAIMTEIIYIKIEQ